MSESSGSQFLRTTTEINSCPDAFDVSRLVLTFLNILGVTEISCSFRLVLEGKTGIEIPESSRLEFLDWLLLDSPDWLSLFPSPLKTNKATESKDFMKTLLLNFKEKLSLPPSRSESLSRLKKLL